MKTNVTRIKTVALALFVALFAFISMPSESVAQRTRTDKGKVTVEREKGKSTPRTAKTSGQVTSGRTGEAAKRGTPAVRSDNNRSRDVRSDNDRSRDARSDNNRSRDVRSDNNRSRDGNVNGVIVGDRSRLNVPKRPIVIDSKRNHVRYSPQIHVNSRLGRSYRPASRISIHIGWPWVVRYERHWSPRYRYRQVVYVESSWGRRNRSSRIEMETTYKHRLKYATDDYAVLDIEIEEVGLYDNGRYIGSVDRIPGNLSKIEATVYRDGSITFDRDVFLVGDRQAGFEMISTRFYDDYALARYKSADGYRVGVLNLRSGKVKTVRHSRLFDPRDYNGFAPISLLPEEEGWLWDYGADAISAERDDYDAYYGYGGGNGTRFRSSDPLRSSSEFSYSTDFGAAFQVRRESNIQRVE